jgi:hypothetical protein
MKDWSHAKIVQKVVTVMRQLCKKNHHVKIVVLENMVLLEVKQIHPQTVLTVQQEHTITKLVNMV